MADMGVHELIRSQDRGEADFGWLQSRHSFSFGSYYNPKQMGISALRVINDDRVAPGAGFDTHGHRDMEIISYVLQGAMVHKDSAGHEQLLPAGEFQLMSAGRGIYHSEYNASQQQPLAFLQIWIKPNQLGGEPGYQQRRFEPRPGLQWVVTPDGREQSLSIKQDAYLGQLQLEAKQDLQLSLADGRNYYLHLIQGELACQGLELQAGDGLKLSQLDALKLTAGAAPVKALWFDLP